MSDRYSHRNCDPEVPTEPGCYEFMGVVKGRGVFRMFPVFFFIGGEDGPQYDDLVKRCEGHWWGPMDPPFKPCPPEQLALLEGG